ncbi:uncharacterized protein GGS22DRAFT_196218 [Annulohypoxylon maeteangense]|uniref:uncharacterized protein n=1 Tax=Annulohypoxylon maeteangense TaxID=1927788 RepID=UPI0020086EBE|nr:uncharacterized protein GGS22DRAFT_196218 [Annulohypoxylon maeteangense]KAI0882057.1 hypothetical protein GGS22DRAFT_196218 [Annulohypoxylon maeteangense]
MDYNHNFAPPPFSSVRNGGFRHAMTDLYHPTFPSQTSRVPTSGNASAFLPPLENPQTTETPSQMDTMMATRTGTFQSWIQNIDDCHKVNKIYLQIHNRPEWDHSEFPSDAKKQQELVKRLFDAANDCSNIFEPEGSRGLKRIQQRTYSDLEFELVLWPLLMSIHDAQGGRCNLPNYHSSTASVYNVYNTFKERFDGVCEALKSSKDIVVSLFQDEIFKHRLAWRPKSELAQKAANRKVNSHRSTKVSIGSRIIVENDIKATADGKLVDRDGQTYGSVPKQTATFESRAKRPRRDITGEQAEFSSDSSSAQRAISINNAGNPEVLEETSHQNYTYQAQLVSQQSLVHPTRFPPNNTDAGKFSQTAQSAEGAYSDQSMGSDDHDLWSPFRKNGDSVYPPLDG